MTDRTLPRVHRTAVLALAAFLGAGAAQEAGRPTFGTTVVLPGGLTGKIYALPPGTMYLPNFDKLEPLGTIYTRTLYVPSREFTEGFPGITDRYEWFAIDFTGRFYVSTPGTYQFDIVSDDGSKVYIDDKLVINADGGGALHGAASVKLSGGIHGIRVSYFQGPRYHLYLMLTVASPGSPVLRPFDVDDFRPPSDPLMWQYGSLAEMTMLLSEGGRRKLTAPVSSGPETPRRNLKDVLRGDVTMVPLSARVTAGSRRVVDLTARDFVVRDGDREQELADAVFSKQVLDIVLLVDSSPAMKARHRQLRGAARRALGELNAADRVGVVGFGQKLIGLLDLSLDREMLRFALERLDTGEPGKELNTALAMTAQQLRLRARSDSRRAIVILTDNRGARGVADRATRDALWRTNVLVYALLADGEAESPRGESDGDIRQFVTATGGELFHLDGKTFPLADALRGIRDRYLLTYRAPGGQPKTIRSVSVELSPAGKARYPDARVLVRGGYVVGEEGEKPPIPGLAPDRK